MTIVDQVKKLNGIIELKSHLEQELMHIKGVGECYFPTSLGIGQHFKLRHSGTTTKVALQAQRIINEQLHIINATLQALDSEQVNIVDILDEYDTLMAEVI
ncbi:hypothetical protein D3C87_1016780 [compost metagenome]